MKLATFEVIDMITPIEERDKIVLATIKGWELVVGKGKFNVGDWCVFIPPDTVVDRTKPWFTFLRNDRIKTEKIAGEYSQGIAIALSDFNGFEDLPDHILMNEEEIEDLDLGPLIGVSKYEKEIKIVESGKNKENREKRRPKILPGFPIHLIPITDEENLKSVKGKYRMMLLEELNGKKVNITKKLDGTSMTLVWDEDLFIMSSRNYSLYKMKGDELEFEFPDDKTDFIKTHKLRDLFRGKKLVIQGELCGPKIGGNKMKLKNLEFYVFTIKELENNRYLSYDEMTKLCNENNLQQVPLIETREVTMETTLAEFQAIADAVKYGDNFGEGIVVRPVEPFISKGLGKRNCSFKLINKLYKD